MIWKSLDTDSPYEISDTGLVRKIYYQKIYTDRDGYQLTTTTIDGVRHNSPVHRLVLHAFDPRENEDELEAHHIDGNPSNNNLSNLMWVTHKENVSYIERRKARQCNKKPVDQFDKDGNFIARYSSCSEAGRMTGCSARHISEVCIGKRKTCGGYIWKRVESSTTNCSSKCCETEDNANTSSIEDIV